MIITIGKISRQRRQGVSKKTGREYDFESLGIAPQEDTLTDINGDEFQRDGRWLNGSTVDGVTTNWGEGDRVKILLVRKTVPTRDGGYKEIINFKLPEGTEAMVEKASTTSEPAKPEVVDNEDF